MFILPEVENFGSKLGKGLGAGIGQGASNLVNLLIGKRQESKENEALKRLTGQDFTGMTPDIRREFLKLYTGGRSQKEQEKQQMLETGLGTIQEMRDLLEYAGGFTSNPLKKLAGLVPGETQEKRAQLAQLGKSLIPMVSAGVSIRNQKEFEEYKKIIADPSASPSELEGALNGVESLLSRQIHQKPGFQEETVGVESKPIFDISNPSHEKVFNALMKKFKGDREKVRRELSKHYEE